jgi:RNA polymerase sigma factor (sigma-70 family)
MARRRDGRDPPDGDVAVAAQEALATVFQEEAGRLAASLVRVLGDFAVAEEVVQDSLLVAWERWQADGVPGNPAGWLWTVARRRALDVARRDARYQAKLAMLAALPGAPDDADRQDDRLALIFTCCHPALSHEAQVALTLRTVSGLSVGQIARAFVMSQAATMQRLTRARRKIAVAGIPYRVPDADHLAERLAAVLAVIYLTFNEGYLTSGGDDPQRRDLTQDAEWLAGLLAGLMPAEPEVLGLLALIRLHRARAMARFDSGGRLVLLADQDRTLWDHAAIAEAADLVLRAARMRRPGPYQIQAAIVACHAEARSPQETDWPQILLLYDALTVYLPTPVVALHRAIAHGQVAGPAAALADLDALGGTLGAYHLFHATRAELLRELGRTAEARRADEQALSLTANPAERALLEQRLSRQPPTKRTCS